MGLSDKLTREEHKDASGALLTTKRYSYDAYGHRLALTVSPQGGATERYTYTPGHEFRYTCGQLR